MLNWLSVLHKNASESKCGHTCLDSFGSETIYNKIIIKMPKGSRQVRSQLVSLAFLKRAHCQMLHWLSVICKNAGESYCNHTCLDSLGILTTNILSIIASTKRHSVNFCLGRPTHQDILYPDRPGAVVSLCHVRDGDGALLLRLARILHHR